MLRLPPSASNTLQFVNIFSFSILLFPEAGIITDMASIIITFKMWKLKLRENWLVIVG